MNNSYLNVRTDVAAALADNKPVVALESTIIAHGLPWPQNLQCARRLEVVVAEHNALAATLAIASGKIKIGLEDSELEHFAKSNRIVKVSRRDLAALIASAGDGATTVAATMFCARMAGIEIFATGGIGGVHRGTNMDISADLSELGNTPVSVVCAGAKSILDLPRTLEVLETQGVPVIGYGTDEFPAFYLRSSGLPVSARVDTPLEAAKIILAQRRLRLGGVVIAVPIPEQFALPVNEVEAWIEQALQEADTQDISGKEITPFLLKRAAELSTGRSLRANLALVENNTRIAAQIACALSALQE